MKKYLVVLFLTVGLIHGFGTGCSSSDAEAEDGEAAVSADEASSEIAEEGVSDDAEAGATEEGGDEEFAVDEGEDMGDEEMAAGDEEGGGDEEMAAGDEEGGGDDTVAENSEDGFDDAGSDELAGEEAMAQNEGGDLGAGEEQGAVAEGGTDAMSQDAGGETDVAESSDSSAGEGEDAGMEPVAPTWVPVKKIAASPFSKNGALLNTVYIGRQGDSLSSISQKIYGSDRSADLLSWNGHLSRGVKVGDKVYYNSSRRPNDNARMLTYYEDVGVEAQHYFSKPGDNIRAVSENLLGHERSWMEVWATNPQVESKGEIDAGVDLRYWPSGVAAPSIAETSLPNEPVAQHSPTVDPGANISPEPVPGMGDPLAMSTGEPSMGDPMAAVPADPGIPDIPDAPPTPAPDISASAGMGAMATPGSSPPGPGATAEAGEEDMTMTLALVGVVLLAGVGLMVVMKKNRTRRMDLTQTQI